MSVLTSLLDALSLAFGMFWEILWALVLGFALSAAVQAVVSKAEMTRLLPDDSPRSLGIACGLGAASSSPRCSSPLFYLRSLSSEPYRPRGATGAGSSLG